MNLGVVPLLSGDSGGVYQYSLMVLKALRQPGVLGPTDTVTLFVHDLKNPLLPSLADPAWKIHLLSPPSWRPRLGALLRRIPFFGALIDGLRRAKSAEARIPEDVDQIRFKPELRDWFRKSGVDLVFYPVPMSISFECTVPYIFVVHDLQHRLQPHFPEVGSRGEWQAREYLFRNGVRNAKLVVADSEIGCEDVLSCYGDTGISPDRVRVLPFVPPSYLPQRVDEAQRNAVRTKYGLPGSFFFYPAQFWPHKNHARLIEALAMLRDLHGQKVCLVLCGSHYNAIRSKTFQEVQTLVKSLNLSDQVRYLGFVSDEDMAALYAEARALVMPTFFGPTNIPILEAWSLGCPVLTSDIRGVRDQAGDAALLCDPASTESLAQGLYRLWCDDDLCAMLKTRGAERLGLYGQTDFSARLADILQLAKNRLAVLS